MKKIFLSITAVASLLFASCDMDLTPIGSLDDETAIETPADLQKARNGIYNNIRSFVNGSYVYLTDLQMDQFLGLIINGNQNGIIAGGTIVSGNSDILSKWAACYSNIADANYLLGRANQVISNAKTEEEALECSRYVAETKFARALYYTYLIDRWSNTYSEANANQAASGVPIVTVFNPTGDINAYPGRSTQAEVYALIDQDLADAYTALKEYEEETGYTPEPMDYYVNSNVVLALQARTAFMRSDWTRTVELCNELINTGAYTLANYSNYKRMWTDDNSNELIFRPISTKTELGIGSIGGAYIDANPEMAYYLPTMENLLMYDDGDVRFDVFFAEGAVKANNRLYGVYLFNKYPGNEALYTTNVNNLLNMGKPFRLSETYLMLAEASYELGDATTANDALNTLRKNRYRSYADKTYAGVELRDMIREERTKELIGEGFRMSDLRRWGLGFSRDASYFIDPSVEEIFKAVDAAVTYAPNDYRYVWPIPSDELQNNPQIRGQQNPGY